MRIWTRKSALIQPRTSPGKSDCVEVRLLRRRGHPAEVEDAEAPRAYRAEVARGVEAEERRR